jgi:hypothetical protein
MKLNSFNFSYRRSIPYRSMKVSAFSKKDGLPSISCKANSIGLPTTKDFTGLRLLPPGNQKRTKDINTLEVYMANNTCCSGVNATLK